jgi:hypothetical protein
MANYIENTNISANKFVNISSRYIDSNVLYYSELKKITFNTYKKKNLSPSAKDRYYVITSGTEYRPDLVSLNAYGTVDFWWKIMESNGIKDVFDFKAGLNIRIPDNVF